MSHQLCRLGAKKPIGLQMHGSDVTTVSKIGSPNKNYARKTDNSEPWMKYKS